MSGFNIGQKVKIISCISREELTGVETTITEKKNEIFTEFDYADVYGVPAYRVAVDGDFRPVETQLLAI